MSSADVALACVTALVDELVRAGTRFAAVAPGSRSTPLALALHRHPGIEVRVHLDERSAAFYALGAAKATGRPAVVACTSGTAAANLLPAVVEASSSRTPLVAVTADRPPELRDTGANQTIDQAKLFGSFAVWSADTGVPQQDMGTYWRSLASRAAAAALGPPAGAVHLNVPLREPLVPTGAPIDLGAAAEGRQDGTPWQSSVPATIAAADDDVHTLAKLIEGHERGVIVAASRASRAVLELADAAGWPLLAEPASGLRRPPHALAAGQLLLQAGFGDTNRPHVVLQLGGPTTSRATEALLSVAEQLVIVDAVVPPHDPLRRAARVVRADVSATAAALAERVQRRPFSGWLETWWEADAAARRVADDLLDGYTDPFEGRVARDLAARAPDGSTLFVASSMPVRDLDTFMAPRHGLRVLANRGASGIDGLVSTALGVSAASDGPTTALLGDLALLHDVSGLMWSARRGHDAVLVVVNNDGGAVFTFLAQAGLPELEELFVTPHGLDLGDVARAAGASYARAERSDQLPELVEQGHAAGGVWLVEAPSDRAANLARHREITDAVRASLA